MGNKQKEQIIASFPSRLLLERNRRGWSQARLAEELGTDTKTVSRWERGQVIPSPYFREKLSKLFAMSLQELGLLETSEAPTVTPLFLFDPAIPLLPAIPLVGRDDMLSMLRQRLQSGGNRALSALNGLPGVGKTALSITLAYDPELHTHFRDGILWAGLGPEPNIMAHAARWGTMLGMSSDEMSNLKDIEALSLALHRTIGSRTMLLVIDDVWKAEDVLRLKIGGLTCAHLITTRFSSIAAQIAADGAATVEELSSDEGMALLRTLAPQVVEQESQRVRELVEAVGGLPLALNLIGNHLRIKSYRTHPRRVGEALQLLSEASARLNLEEAHGPAERHSSQPGAASISLRSIIAVSDQQLDEPVRHAFYALAVFPPKPNSFSEEAAMAVADCNTEALDALTEAGLLEITSSSRYTMHQTIADYARMHHKDRSAKLRMTAYITDFVETHRQNYELLESESSNILAALDVAVEEAHSIELIRIAVAFSPFLLARGLYPTANTHLLRAYHTAIATEDYQGLASTLLYLGETTWKRGDYGQAKTYLQEGLEYARKINDHERICAILAPLGSISWKSGDYKQAHAYLQEGLMLARALKNLERMPELLQVLGSLESMRGNYKQAEAFLQEGLELARHVEDRELTCLILLSLGAIAGEQGNHRQAEALFQEGLLLARQLNHHEWVCGLLNNLGDSFSEQEDYEQAMAYFQEGLELARRIEHREWISFLLLNLGLTARRQKNYPLSEHSFQESLIVARQIGIPQIICHALYGYGEVHLDRHLFVQAEDNFREMLALAPEGEPDFIALARYGLARLAGIDGRLEEARQLGEQSVAALETLGRREATEVKNWLCSLDKTFSSSGEKF